MADTVVSVRAAAERDLAPTASRPLPPSLPAPPFTLTRVRRRNSPKGERLLLPAAGGESGESGVIPPSVLILSSLESNQLCFK